MQILQKFLLILTISILGLTACNDRATNRRESEKITVFSGNLDSVAGPANEVALLRSFPKALYKIYNIDSLGSFYIDSRSDMIKNELREGRKWEGVFTALMKQHIKPGTTVIDIGAHIGTLTLSMSKLVGDQGRVIAFEPQIKLYSELVMNMILNQCKNVTAYRCAVGDAIKTIEMNPSVPGNEGATSIGKGGDAAEMITLDSLHLENVSFIKIDVENFEYEVLLGAEQTIRKNRPYMILEIMGNTFNPNPSREELVHRTLHKIEEMGYTLQYIDGSWSDWVAIPLEKN